MARQVDLVSVDEKAQWTEEDSVAGDEALQLVGKERQQTFDDEYNARLRRKLDLWIIPLCASVYFSQYLDKTSLGYASIMDLPIVGQQYNLISLAFYFGFLVAQFPTVYIAQRTGRMAKYLGANIIVWGVILMLHSIAGSFGSFFALRFLLGMCESCVAPILNLTICMWYKKHEQARRISWFYCMVGMAQIAGGFIAYGVSFYTGGILAPAYKVLYIAVGALAILNGIAIVLWLPDSPVKASRLSQEEKIAALERIRDDQVGTENKHIKKSQIIEALTDIRTWLVIVMNIMNNIPQGGLGAFTNIIIRNFGYTSKQALILSTPQGAVTVISVLFCAWWSDLHQERMIPTFFSLVPTVIGSALLIGLNGSGNKGVLLFGIYVTNFSSSSLSIIYAYNASNTAGHTKKSTIQALTLASFAVGNMVGTEIFLPQDAPAYIPGKTAILTLFTIQMGLALVLRYINVRMNRQKRKTLERLVAEKGWTEDDVRKERQRHAFLDLTDKECVLFSCQSISAMLKHSLHRNRNPFFEYTV